MVEKGSRLKNYLHLCPVTSSLLAINTAAFIITIITGGFTVDNLWKLGGLVPDAVKEGDYYRVLFSMFLHGSFIHFFSNMLALYFLGTPMERILGKWRYLILYMVSGLGAGVLIVLFGSGNTLTIGASTAIYGLMAGLFFITFSKKHWFTPRSVWAIRILTVINFIITFIYPNISEIGHLGGFGIGFILTLFLLPDTPDYLKPKQHKGIHQDEMEDTGDGGDFYDY